MKVTLINPKTFIKFPQPPIGVALLAGILERSGCEVQVIDANLHQIDGDAIYPLIRGDMVCISSSYVGIYEAIKSVKSIKKHSPKMPVLLGGSYPTLFPDEVRKYAPEFDLIYSGEGDAAILQMVSAVRDGVSLNEIVFDRRPADLDKLPYLAYHLLDYEEYRPHPPHGRHLPYCGIVTSRGCPYRCSYCAKTISGAKFRGQSPSRVVDEIEHLVNALGIREISIFDDVFTLDKERAVGIAQEIIERRIKVSWSFDTRVNLVDKDMLRLFKKSGCYSVAYGIETGSAELLKVINKGITLEQVKDAVRWSKEAGITTLGYLMIGLPGETPETIEQTMNFAEGLKLDYAQYSVTIPYPGTELYEIYKKDHATDSWAEFIYSGGARKPPVFENKLLSREEIERWATHAYRHFYLRPEYVLQRVGGIRSMDDVRMGFRGLKALAGMS